MARPSQLGLSSAYERAVQACIAAYMSSGLSAQQAQAAVDNAILSQSYLRLEIQLLANTNSYELNVLNNQNNAGVSQRPTEVRLTQQDSFFASQIGIYLAKASSTTDYSFSLQTYPNAITFPTGAATLNTLYNGYGIITVNNQKIVPKFPISDFYQVPQTQLTAATNSPITQFDPTEVGLLQPNINFVGTSQSTFNIILPQNLTALDTATYLVIILKGVLAQNITIMV